MSRIALVLFSNSGCRGGVEEYILTLLTHLDRERFRLFFVCSPVVASLLEKEIPAGVEVVPLLLNSPKHTGAALRLMRFLRSIKAGILHSHLFYSSLFASPLGRLCRVPVVMETPHIRECWRKGWKSHYSIDRTVARCVDWYIAVSDANARYLIEQKKIPPAKIRTIRYGLDLKRFDAVRAAPAGMRAAWGLAASDVVAVVAARLAPQKGHAVLLESMRRVRERAPAVRVVCIGDGELREKLEKQAREMGLEEVVRFAGFQRNTPEWIAMADFTVLPSHFEGLPLAAMESLAGGKAVIATAVDGTPELVRDGRTGVLVKPDDPAALADAIVRLASDAALRHDLGAAGSALAAERFTRERFIRESEELYLRAWQARRGTR